MTTKQIEEMKKYIGPREVWAEPMTEYAAIEKGIHPKSEDGHVLRAGYKVVLPIPNGSVHECWIDKVTFEACYTGYDSPEERLSTEIREVQERLYREAARSIPSSNLRASKLRTMRYGLLCSYLGMLEMQLADLTGKNT